MPDFNKLLARNPFSDDDGSLKPELAQAFESAETEWAVNVVTHLDRVIIPVIPHEHPGTVKGDDGRLRPAQHDSASSNPLDRPDEELTTVDFPGGRTALAVFSSAQALAAWNPKARPVPASTQQVAVTALKRGSGLLTLDPGQPTQTWLGRTAVIALATESTWLAPWDDPKIPTSIRRALGEDLTGLVDIRVSTGYRGVSVVEIHIDASTPQDDVLNIAHAVAAVVGSEPYVKARLDLVELRPVPVRNSTGVI